MATMHAFLCISLYELDPVTVKVIKYYSGIFELILLNILKLQLKRHLEK